MFMRACVGEVVCKPRRDQRLQRRHRLLGLGAFRRYADTGARAGGQHHQPHDRGAADRDTVLFDAHFRLEAADQLHEFGRGACMQPTLVDDLELANQRRRHGEAIFH
jgi:hypothetical protein